MTELKFIDLTIIAGMLEVQTTTLDLMIKNIGDTDIDSSKFLKNELKQLKSTSNKVKKLIAEY